MELQDLYIFYLKDCTDKKITPLFYKEWVLNRNQIKKTNTKTK